MTERGACRVGVSAEMCLQILGCLMEKQGASGDVGADKDALGMWLFWQASLALYQAPISPWVLHQAPAKRGRGCPAPPLGALLPAPAQLLDAAWPSAGSRQVTSPKVNADGCAGKH